MSQSIRRVLIVDDEDIVREAYRGALSAMAPTKARNLAALEKELFGKAPEAKLAEPHYELAMAGQGVEAIEAVRASLAENRPFGVIFLDMRMPPGIDGLETAKQIRALDPALNIVLVTGYSDVDIAEIAAQVPPADKIFFIAKPFHVTEIRQQAAALSARWRYESALVRELQSRNLALEAAAAEARAARNEAEQANIAKSAFLANVSHELRTPLNAVIGFSDIMAEETYGPLGDPRYLDYNKQINVAGRSLLGTINDIIDTARLDIGKLELILEHLNASECIAQAVAELRTLADRKSVAIALPGAAQTVEIVGDRRRLHQVLFAVLHNAVEFSPAGARVDVGVECRAGETVISVRDQGPGMSADLIEAVQRPFAQGESNLARNHGGLGLNLSLAKRLIELHGGRFEIASSLGQGVTVRIGLGGASAATNAA